MDQDSGWFVGDGVWDRWWSKLYDLCHTFLHVVQVTKHTAMWESHSFHKTHSSARITRISLAIRAWPCVFWLEQRAKSVTQIMYLGPLPTVHKCLKTISGSCQVAWIWMGFFFSNLFVKIIIQRHLYFLTNQLVGVNTLPKFQVLILTSLRWMTCLMSSLPNRQRFYLLRYPWIYCMDYTTLEFELYLGQLKMLKLRPAVSGFQPLSPEWLKL